MALDKGIQDREYKKFTTNVGGDTSVNTVGQLVDDLGNPIGVNFPLPTNGDSVYSKDVNTDVGTDIGTFSGDILSLFNDYEVEISDVTGTNPKTFTLNFKRPVTTSYIGITSKTGDFSNVKLLFKDASGNVRKTVDDSSNSTKYSSNLYFFSPTQLIQLTVEFHTLDSVSLNGMYIPKDMSVVSRMQALKDDGTITNIGATDSGNLRVTDAESGLAISKGDVSGHSVVLKFGQNDGLNTSTYEDIWDGGGTYTYPANGTAPITHIYSTGVDVEPIEVQGLDITGALTVQTITLTGTTVAALTTPLWRVFRMKNVSTTATDILAASVVHASDSGKVVSYAQIQNGNNQTLMALYTIPLGKTGYMVHGTNSLSGTSRAYAVAGRLTMRQYSSVFQLKKTFGLQSDGSSFLSMDFPLPSKIPALTDIRVSAISSIANGVVNTTFDIVLVDD